MTDSLMNWLLMGTQIPNFERRLEAAAEIARLREHLAEAERQRDAARTEALEEAVVAVRAGRWKNRDWVPGSLWDKLRAEMERDIRALIKEDRT